MTELDDQQLTYLILTAKNVPVKAIKKELSLGSHSLWVVRRSIFDALGAKTWPHAIAIAFREGIFKVTSHEVLPSKLGEQHTTILRLIAEGVPQVEQTKLVGLKMPNLRYRTTQIYKALGVTCAEEAVYEACQTGLLEI